MDFGDRLAELRKQRVLTQADLAERVGIHPSQLHRYEAGTAEPTLHVLRALAMTLQVSADALVFDTNPPSMIGKRLQTAYESASFLSEHEQAVIAELIEAFVHAHWAKYRPPKPARGPRRTKKKS